MNIVVLIKRYPVLTFLILVAALEIASVLAAFLLAAVEQGRAGVKSLWSGMTRWRIGLGGVVLALGLPLAGTLAIVLLAALLGSPGAFHFGPLSPILLVFSLIFNGLEEIGWRGFALPRLLRSHAVLPASLILGAFWGMAHLPLHLPGQWYAALTLWPTPIILIAYSVLLSWVYVRTGGSVLATTLCHAMLNFLTPLTGGIDLTLSWWLRAAVFTALAAGIALLARPEFTRKFSQQPETV